MSMATRQASRPDPVKWAEGRKNAMEKAKVIKSQRRKRVDNQISSEAENIGEKEPSGNVDPSVLAELSISHEAVDAPASMEIVAADLQERTSPSCGAEEQHMKEIEEFNEAVGHSLSSQAVGSDEESHPLIYSENTRSGNLPEPEQSGITVPLTQDDEIGEKFRQVHTDDPTRLSARMEQDPIGMDLSLLRSLTAETLHVPNNVIGLVERVKCADIDKKSTPTASTPRMNSNRRGQARLAPVGSIDSSGVTEKAASRTALLRRRSVKRFPSSVNEGVATSTTKKKSMCTDPRQNEFATSSRENATVAPSPLLKEKPVDAAAEADSNPIPLATGTDDQPVYLDSLDADFDVARGQSCSTDIEHSTNTEKPDIRSPPGRPRTRSRGFTTQRKTLPSEQSKTNSRDKLVPRVDSKSDMKPITSNEKSMVRTRSNRNLLVRTQSKEALSAPNVRLTTRKDNSDDISSENAPLGQIESKSFLRTTAGNTRLNSSSADEKTRKVQTVKKKPVAATSTTTTVKDDPEDPDTRRMFDKNTLRLNGRDIFIAAIKEWRQNNTSAHTSPKANKRTLSDILVCIRKRPIFKDEEHVLMDYDVVTAFSTAVSSQFTSPSAKVGILSPGSSREDTRDSRDYEGISRNTEKTDTAPAIQIFENAKSGKIVIHNCLYQPDLKTPFLNHLEYKFDRIFTENVNNSHVYEHSGIKGMVERLSLPLAATSKTTDLACIFMFGQTGSGKTHTMGGIEEFSSHQIFKNEPSEVKVTFVELCGKRVFDLLSEERAELRLREAGRNIVFLENQTERRVHTASELHSLISECHGKRKTRSTKANDVSSRSHAICRITIQRKSDGSTPKIMKLASSILLVDCAGTERRKDSMMHDAERQAESAEINASLYALKECIRWRSKQLRKKKAEEMADATKYATESESTADQDKESQQNIQEKKKKTANEFLPFRGSVLTRILAEAFTKPNTELTVIATLSPCASDIEHSVTTLNTVLMLNSSSPEGRYTETKQSDLIPETQSKANPHPKTWTNEETVNWIQSVSVQYMKSLSKTKPSAKYSSKKEGLSRSGTPSKGPKNLEDIPVITVTSNTDGSVVSRWSEQRFIQLVGDSNKGRFFYNALHAYIMEINATKEQERRDVKEFHLRKQKERDALLKANNRTYDSERAS